MNGGFLRLDRTGLPDDPIMAGPYFVAFRLVAKPGKPGKVDKLPINPHTGALAATDDPTTWGTVPQVVAAIVLDRYGVVGIDVDASRDPASGAIAPWAQEVIDLFAPCYWGPSVSGTGVRLLVRGRLPGGGHKRGAIEVYDDGWHLTLVGHLGPGAVRTLAERQPQLDAFLAAHFPRPVAPRQVRPGMVVLGDDADLIERARAERDGGAFDRLWCGDLADVGGDESAADYRLARRLAFWTGGDADRVERLMRGSGLVRPKWESRRGTVTYLRHTIARACADQGECYRHGDAAGRGRRVVRVRPVAGTRRPVIHLTAEGAGHAR